MNSLKPPKAYKQAFSHKKFKDERVDPYHWLKNQEDPKVLEYLKSENQYANKHLEKFQDISSEIFKEMHARIPVDFETAPYKQGEYFYYESWSKGQDYPVYKRFFQNKEQVEVLLDVNKLAKGKDYVDVDGIWPSPNQKILAYALDEQGREFYTIILEDLTNPSNSLPRIKQVTSDFVWADNKTLFYTKQHKETLRPYQVYKFDISTGKEELVFQEDDELFSVSLNKPLSEKYIFILASSTQTTECWFLDIKNMQAGFSLFRKREKDHKYFIDHGEDNFYILTNQQACFNYKLVTAKETDRHTWKDLIDHNENLLIEDFNVFSDFLALEVRGQAKTDLLILDKKTKKLDKVLFDQDVYVCEIGTHAEYKTEYLRINFSTPVTPPQVYDYELKTSQKNLIKVYPMPKGFSSEDYVCKRLLVLSRDQVKIPCTLVYRKDTQISSSTPLLLYGYGSYGISMDSYFDSQIFSLLDRGFIYAVAHVRGGSEMSKSWYYAGRLLNKKHTFTDFIDCAKFLIEQEYTSSKSLYIQGASAGGLLVGAVLNEAPHLFHGAIAKVPFVDVLSTILDDKIPLSVGEYEEWGNPNEEDFYHYIKSYSPYDQVKKTKYPHLFIRAGLHDPRVQYWEPAKWCARLRDYKTDDNLLLLQTSMESGHFGPTGRLNRLKKQALEQAFFVYLSKM